MFQAASTATDFWGMWDYEWFWGLTVLKFSRQQFLTNMSTENTFLILYILTQIMYKEAVLSPWKKHEWEPHEIKTMQKTLSTIFIYRQRSNSRAGIHTTVKHVSCSTPWTAVFLSEQLCNGATEGGCDMASQQRRTRSTSERAREQTKAGPSLTPVGGVLEWSAKSGQRSSRGLSPHLSCVKPSPLCNTLKLQKKKKNRKMRPAH